MEAARRWPEENVGDGRYRVVIVRRGYVVAEWNHGIDRGVQLFGGLLVEMWVKEVRKLLGLDSG